jgi:DNA-directed RNA polymerase specialized sigma24 family protein
MTASTTLSPEVEELLDQFGDYVEGLEERVRTADAKLAALPKIARRLADERQAALQAYMEGLCVNGIEAARMLGWHPNTVYRILSGRAGRTSARRRKD